MISFNSIDRQGYFLTILIIVSIFFGSSTIGISIGSFFVFPLRFFCVLAIPFVLFSLFQPKKYSILTFFLIFIFSYAISIGLLFYSKVYIEQLSVLQIGVTIAMMMIGYINSNQRLLKVFLIWSFGALIVNIISIIEVSTGTFLLNTMDKGLTFSEGMGFLRPISIYTNSNNLAFLNVISSVVQLCIFFSGIKISKFLSVVNLCSFILTVVALLFSYSRACIFSLILILFFYLFYTSYRNKSLKLLLKWFCMVSIGIIVIYSLFPEMINRFVNILTLFMEKVSASGESGGDDTRLNFFFISLDKLVNNFGIGGGPGYSWNDFQNDKGLVGPHNFFLEIMVDYGVVSLICYTVILITSYKKLLKKNFSNFRIVLAGSILSFFILTFTTGSTIGAPSFWFWLALINICTIYDINQNPISDNK